MKEIDKIDNGGPVFPTQQIAPPYAAGSLWMGMSVRDYFAAHAPKVPNWFITTTDMKWDSEKTGLDPEISKKLFFQWRWYYADQMIKARGEE